MLSDPHTKITEKLAVSFINKNISHQLLTIQYDLQNKLTANIGQQ